MSGATLQPADAEVSTVGHDHSVIHVGAEVRRDDGLEPATEYHLHGATFRTLPRPGGELLCRVATVNDIHFGEVRCGLVEGHEDSIGPILSAPEGAPPYPVTMNEAAIGEIGAIDPIAVLAKGDLTTDGTDAEYQAFLDTYGRAFGDRLHHVRGNHDAYHHQDYAAWPTQRVDVPGATLALLDTTVPGKSSGGLQPDQLEWLDTVAAEADRPVLVFGHHHVWDPGSANRPDDYFGIHPDASEALVAVAARRSSITGYFAGHTHRNRVRRLPATGAMPWVEVACVKDYPGAWAEYQVFEGGILQLHHRISRPEALAWTEQTRHMFLGTYADYAFGSLDDRCFVVER